MVGDYEIKRIGELDGIRVLAISIVVWFHFWQQCWIMPMIGDFSLDFLPRFGYQMVDMMILLSGFLLALPYARETVYKEKAPNAKNFYVNRIARIAPSYYLIVLVIFFAIALPTGQYGNGGDAAKDLVPHLFFVHNLFPESYVATHLDGALWTVAVLMQLYLIFPLLVRLFQKNPIVTYIGMVAVGLISTYLFLGMEDIPDDYMKMSLIVNNTLSFLPVYAGGMLGAFGYVYFTRGRQRNRILSAVATVVAIGCVPAYKMCCDMLANSEYQQAWQLENRYLLSWLYLIFVLAVLLSAKWFRKIFDNCVMHWLAGISFSMYMVHQYVSQRLAELDIPHMTGSNPGECGTAWQWEKLALCLVISIPIAIALTYLVERPCSKWVKKHFLQKNAPKAKSA